ncbi:MAG: mechanosensitive ion channel family protein [Nitrospirae bacterium]|nr:mechanosensitive ion channel family protein [Nitrospirota bacterium]
MDSQHLAQLTSQFVDWIMGEGIPISIVLAAMFLGLTVSKRGLFRLQKLIEGNFPEPAHIKRATTLTNVLGDVLRILIAGVGITTILSQLGIDLGPLLVAAGIGGVAIGFGAQSLVKDVISGFFILLENQVRVGDVVNIAGVGGLVEDVGLRTISLRDLAGNVHTVPNGTITTVTNMTMGYSRYVFNVGVAYREDVDQVMSILKDVAAELQKDPKYGPDILEPLEMLGVDSFADSAIIIKCRIMTNPIQQWTIGREMNRRIKIAFDAHGIEIPFPHRTIYWGEPKESTAPPLNIMSMPSSS